MQKQLGKADYRLFRSVARLTGSERRDVLLGPMLGADFGVVDLGNGRAVAVSTDPIYVNEHMPLRDAAWFAFHVIVADVALSGLSPSHLALCWNLPPEMDDRTFLSMCRVFHSEASSLNMSIVTGHTGRYVGCKPPVMGAGTSMAAGMKERLILPARIRSGDRLIVTKTPGLETALLLCHEFGQLLEDNVGRSVVASLRKKLRMLSPVADAAAAAGVTGVNAMHDASERGIYGALHELSWASGLSFVLERENIPRDRDVEMVADFLGFDTLESSSEGTLLVVATEDSAPVVVESLAKAGIRSGICGSVTRGRSRLTELAPGGKQRNVGMPVTDGYLAAISAAKRKSGR